MNGRAALMVLPSNAGGANVLKGGHVNNLQAVLLALGDVDSLNLKPSVRGDG